MNTITPAAAQALLANGVTLVDIRSADEYAREHIAGAQRLDVAALQAEQFTAPVIFHCRLGHSVPGSKPHDCAPACAPTWRRICLTAA